MGGMEAHGFRDLICRAQAGDAEAVEGLLAAVRPYLEAQARRYLNRMPGWDSIAHVVQDAWLRVWERLRQFDGAANDEETLAAFRKWVRTVLRNVGSNHVRDSHRKRRRPKQPLVSLDAGAPGRSPSQANAAEPAANQSTPSANVRAGEKAQMVLAAVDQLPDEKDRAIVRLRFFDGLSLRQIADRLQLSYDLVRERFRSSLRRLERRLEELR